MNSEYVTLNATIKLVTETTDGLNYKKKREERRRQEEMRYDCEKRKEEHIIILLLVCPEGQIKLVKLPSNSVCV